MGWNLKTNNISNIEAVNTYQRNENFINESNVLQNKIKSVENYQEKIVNDPILVSPKVNLLQLVEKVNI